MTRDTYTHGHHESVLRSHQWRTAANSAAYLLPHLSSGMSVLDIGCGPGTITLDLAAAVTPGRVLGLDVVPEPLDTARANALAYRVSFYQLLLALELDLRISLDTHTARAKGRLVFVRDAVKGN